MASRGRASLTPERRTEIRVEGLARRTVGAWRNALRFSPGTAEQVRRELPDLVEALEELADVVMPKGVSGTPFSL